MNENTAGMGRSHPRRRSLRGFRRAVGAGVRLLVVAVAGLGMSGFAHAVAQPVEHESPDAATAARSIIGDSPSGLSVPPGFEDVMGYRPVGEVVMMDPDGGCSTPIGSSSASFEQACRVHDLGYDVLRYAEQTGGRLGPWARFGADRRLYRDLRQTCRTTGCRATSTLYFAALTANSVRQGYRAPTDEPAIPWTLGAVAVATVALAQPRISRRLKTHRRSRTIGACATPPSSPTTSTPICWSTRCRPTRSSPTSSKRPRTHCPIGRACRSAGNKADCCTSWSS